jgi:hypothetical protein
MNVSEQIKQVNLKELVESTDCELRQRGNRFVALCPIHGEDHPSFYVFPDNHFKCFGCGEYGDAVDFLRLVYDYDFLEALRHLGISNGQLTPKQRQEIERKKKIEAERIQRERDIIYTLSLLIRSAHKRRCFVHLLPLWEFYHETLISGSEEEKQKTIDGLKDWPTISRRYLFKQDFNYRGWLRNYLYNNGVPENEQQQRVTLTFNAN